MLWQTLFFRIFDVAQAGAFRLYHAGQRLGRDWNRYPLHVTPSVSLPGAGVLPIQPSATRSQDTLLLTVTPFGDNQPGDTGTGYESCTQFTYSCQGRYALYQNGAKILSGDAAHPPSGVFPPPALSVKAPLSPRPSLIKFVLNASRAYPRPHGKPFVLSTTSRDVWTWRTRRQPGATVPAPWYCSATAPHGSPVYDRHCAVQDMTTLRYTVAGLSLSGTAGPGRQRIAITATPLQLSQAPPVTHAGLRVSFDSGKTWHPAAITTISPGHFRATFTAPAGAVVTLRTHAAAAGATVTETILDAYRTAAH